MSNTKVTSIDKLQVNNAQTQQDELPKGWKWLKLREVAKVVNGVGFPINLQGKKSGEYLFIKVSDMNSEGSEEYIVDSHNRINKEDLFKIGGKPYPPDTIIFPKVGGAISTNKKRILGMPSCFDNNIMGVIPEKIQAKYLYYWFLTVDLKGLSNTQALSSIRKTTIEELKVPVSPREIQNETIEILDSQKSIITNTKKSAEMQLEDLIKLKHRILFETLTKCHQVDLKDCLNEVVGGIGSKWAKYPVYGATRQGLAPAKEKVGKKPERYKPLYPGTIFYNPMRINIGSIAMLGDNDPPGITSPDYVVIRTKEKILHPVWFYYWLRSIYGENLIKSLARGAVRERMLYKRLSKGIIVIPEYREQEIAAKKFLEIENLISKIKEQINLIDLLPQAYLRRAFSGEFL